MQITIKREKEYLREGELVLCEVDVALPSTTEEGRGGARLSRFYTRTREAILRLASEGVLPHARAALEAIEPSRRRAVVRPYRLTVSTALTPSDRGISVLRTLTLTHRGRVLYTEQVSEAILEGGRIIPTKPKEIKKRKKARS